MMYKALPAKQSYFSRILEITFRAGDVSSTATKRPSCNDTGQHGYTTFQPSDKSPSAVRMVTAGKSTMKFSPKPESFSTLQSVPSHPTRFEHCPNSTEVLTQAGHPFLVSTGGVTNTGGSRGTTTTRSFPDGGRGNR